MLTNSFGRRLNRNPDLGDNAGGGGGLGDGGSGNAGAASSGAADGGASAGGSATGAPARDYSRDIESIRGQFSEFGKKFDSFHQDYQSRFNGNGGQSQGSKEPKISDYPNTQEGVLKFIDDRSKFLARAEFTGLQEESDKKAKEQASASKRSAALQSHVGRISEAAARYKDFDQVINNAAMQLPPNIQDDVLDSPFSADLHYHLSKYPADLYKVVNAYAQSERTGARLLGAIEHRYELEAAQRKAAAKKTRFGTTETVDADVGGNPGEDAENESIARESFKLKKK